MPRGSREFSYFNREKNVRNGVVVECNWNKADYIVHTIADFTKHQCVYTLRSCFKTRQNPETRSQFYKDERPYEVFENVNFEADEYNLVPEKVARNQKKWECSNMGNDVFAVRDVCIFSRDTPRKCYSELAGIIVPYNDGIADEILTANVPFDCFLQFSFTPSNNVNLDNPAVFSLQYKVHSIEQVNPEQFGLAFKTPWLKFTQPVYEDYDPFNLGSDPEKLKLLPGIKGYALTGNKVYIPSRPRWSVSLAHNKITSLLKIHQCAQIKPHMPLLLDVRYNDNINRYIVYDATARGEKEFPATLTKDRFHQALLSPVPDCPGYFTFRDIGLVFDKYGRMVSFYSSDRQAKINADFTYVDPDERAYTQLEIRRVYDKNDIDLMAVTFEGFYIGNNEFYCPFLHFWILRAPGDMECSIGSWYRLKIDEIHEDEGIADVEAQILPQYDPVPHKMVQENIEFLVEIGVHRAAGNQILVAPYIGPIGITEIELARFENIKAVAIQFPLPEELREDRVQVRPQMTKTFKTFEQGKSVGGYK
uniref:Uncharacterized protein n=1 Tax=Panagrolaimus superbus TaxID=310955 RepID=A0A914XYD6_9BILA